MRNVIKEGVAVPPQPSCYCLCWAHLLWTASDRLLMAATFPITNFPPPQSSRWYWYVTPAHSFMSFYFDAQILGCVVLCTPFSRVFTIPTISPCCWIYSSSYLFAPVSIICRNSECSCLFPAAILFWGSSQEEPFCRFYRYYLVVFFSPFSY